MKTKIVALFIFILQATANAQTWSDVGGGLNQYGQALSFGEYANTLYVGGNFLSAGAVNSTNIAKWNGIGWGGVGGGTNGFVHAILEYDGQLYAVGSFTTFNGMPASKIAVFNGTVWTTVLNGFDNAPQAMAEYNTKLYIAGTFLNFNGNPAGHIIEFDGVNWNQISNSTSPNEWINCLAVYNGELYAAGVFNSINGVPALNIAKWNGTSWSAVGTGVNYIVYAMGVYNNELYVGGMLSTAGSAQVKNIAKWNGTTWSNVGMQGVGPNTRVFALQAYNGKLYVGGEFDSIGTAPYNRIATWDGSSWATLGSGVTGAVIGNLDVEEFGIYNNELYVGGYFSNAGGIPTTGIARLSTPTGINDESFDDNSVSIYPNPVNDEFKIQSLKFKIEDIKVYDVFGKVIFSTTVPSFSSRRSLPIGQAGSLEDEAINVSTLPPGIYFLRLSNGKEQVTRKILIQRQKFIE